MSQMKVGSINVTALVAAMRANHPAFKRGKKNPDNIYADVVMWVNDEKDENGFDTTLVLNPPKEKRKEIKKVYIGNLKSLDKPGADEQENIPEGQTVIAKGSKDPLDDLPF